MRRYSDLYGAYTEAEVIYTDDRTLELSDSLTAADRERSRSTGDGRLAPLPPGRALPGGHAGPPRAVQRNARSRRSRSASASSRCVALFDMEGTILPSNVVESYVWSRMADLPRDQWPPELASVFARIPSYLMADRRDRGEFLRTFFRRYEGATRRGHRAPRRRVRRRVHAAEGLRRGDPPDPRAPRRRPSHDDDHRGGRAVRPAAGAAVRRRDRRASSRCATAATPASWPSRRSWARRAPRGSAATPSRRAST